MKVRLYERDPSWGGVGGGGGGLESSLDVGDGKQFGKTLGSDSPALWDECDEIWTNSTEFKIA